MYKYTDLDIFLLFLKAFWYIPEPCATWSSSVSTSQRRRSHPLNVTYHWMMGLASCLAGRWIGNNILFYLKLYLLHVPGFYYIVSLYHYVYIKCLHCAANTWLYYTKAYIRKLKLYMLLFTKWMVRTYFPLWVFSPWYQHLI